jgi:hypothetical protein
MLAVESSALTMEEVARHPVTWIAGVIAWVLLTIKLVGVFKKHG